MSAATPVERMELLVQQRASAKRTEEAAVAARRVIDAEIVELGKDPAKTEGSTTKTWGATKVTVTLGIERKAHTDALKEKFESLSAAVQGAFRWVAEVDVKALKALSKEDALAASEFITSKPSSPSLKLEIA